MTQLVKLPRLPVNWEKQPQLFERYWSNTMSQIESNINSILVIPEIQAAVDAANAAAAAANAAAATANTVASDALSNNALTNSGVSGATITATDAGGSCTVSISAHTRLYGDGTSASVLGDDITGLAYSTTYYIYYDQSSKAGGAVSYQTTTVKTTAAQINNRHLVGSVVTPAASGLPVLGKYVDVSGLGSLV